MAWRGLNRNFPFCIQVTEWLQHILQTIDGEDLPVTALPGDDRLDDFAAWRNQALNEDERLLAERMLLWLRIRKQFTCGALLPTEPDIAKSALFERLRHGIEPLPP